MAFEAARFEDRLDLGVEFDAARLHGFHLTLVGRDLLGEEGVDGVVRREARDEGGDGRLRRLGEPLLGGLAALLPVFALAGAGGGAGGGVDLAEANFFLRGVGVPAGVVVIRSVAHRRQQLPVGASAERDGGDGLAEFRAAAVDDAVLVADHVAHDRFEDHAVFAALGFEFDPGVAVARRREAEVAAEVEVLVLVLDRLVVRAGRRERGLKLELAVDEERGGAASAEQQAMLAGGKLHDAEGAEQVRMAAFGAHAGVDVFLGHAREAEGRGDVAVGDLRSLLRPDVGGRLPGFAEFDAHLAVRDGGPVDLRGLADDFRRLGGLHAAGAVVAGVGARSDLRDLILGDRGQGGGEAVGDLLGRHERAMQADLIDRAAEAAVGEAALRGADPHGRIVDDRFGRRLSVHVPRALDLLAVDPAADALRLAELITDGDVVPATVVGEAGRGGPAVPLHALAGGRREEEVQAGGVVEHAQAHGPVLVARVGGLRVGAALADDRGVLAFAQSVGSYPGLDRQRVAVLEIEEAVRAGVLDLDTGALTVEGGGLVLLLEARVVRAAGAGLFEGHAADGGEFGEDGAIEIPDRDRLGFGEGRETEEQRGETTHLQVGQGRGGRGSAGGVD